MGADKTSPQQYGVSLPIYLIVSNVSWMQQRIGSTLLKIHDISLIFKNTFQGDVLVGILNFKLSFVLAVIWWFISDGPTKSNLL